MKSLTTIGLILFKVIGTYGNCRSIQNIDFDSVPLEDLFVPNPLIIDGSVASSGVITSPNYPQNYNPDEQCGYIIRAPGGSRIRLEFTDYNLNSDVRFGVLDGNPSPFGGTYTAFPGNTNEIPPPFESDANLIGINFSAGLNTNRGWRMVYTIINSKSKPLIFIDSNTSTLMLAVAMIVGLFLYGLLPIKTILTTL